MDHESDGAAGKRGDESYATGAERCPCHDDGRCDPGLTCASNVCGVSSNDGGGGSGVEDESGGSTGTTGGVEEGGASLNGGASTGSVGGGGGTGGAVTGGIGGAVTGGTGGSVTMPSDCPMDWPRLPGTPITDLETSGVGACAGRRLAELTDVTSLAPYPYTGIDGSRVHAFLTDTGFALVAKSGSSDCEAGCLENWYRYYLTDENCEPQLVGSFDPPIVDPSGCLELVGAIAALAAGVGADDQAGGNR